MAKVLIIDDDRFTQNMLHRSLFKLHEVRTADDGESGLRLADTWQPDVILLDVEMPGKNGYEVCDVLKHSTKTADIPVIFLSSRTSTREHMLGYEMGGDDFLTKPCSQEVLRKKLALLSDYYRQKKNLKNSADKAGQTALEAMATSFEIGKSFRFVERSYSIANFDGLGAALMEILLDFDLSACALLATQAGPRFYSTQTAVAPIEKEILTKLRSEQRFIDFGCRTQINYPQMSLLIKNMPLQDRSKYGRIKDTVTFLLGAADAKIRVLDAEQALRAQNRKLLDSVQVMEKLLEAVNSKLNDGTEQIRFIMSGLTELLSLELHRIGLEKDQEDYVLEKVDATSDALHANLVQSQPIEATLKEIIRLLNGLAVEQDKIISENLSSEGAANSDSITEDIELF